MVSGGLGVLGGLSAWGWLFECVLGWVSSVCAELVFLVVLLLRVV